jgi:hypothetical protein
MALGAASLAHVIVLDLQTDNKICMTGWYVGGASSKCSNADSILLGHFKQTSQLYLILKNGYEGSKM